MTEFQRLTAAAFRLSIFAAVMCLAGGFVLGHMCGRQAGVSEAHAHLKAYRARMIKECDDLGGVSGMIRSEDKDLEMCWFGSNRMQGRGSSL